MEYIYCAFCSFSSFIDAFFPNFKELSALHLYKEIYLLLLNTNAVFDISLNAIIVAPTSPYHRHHTIFDPVEQ